MNAGTSVCVPRTWRGGAYPVLPRRSHGHFDLPSLDVVDLHVAAQCTVLVGKENRRFFERVAEIRLRPRLLDSATVAASPTRNGSHRWRSRGSSGTRRTSRFASAILGGAKGKPQAVPAPENTCVPIDQEDGRRPSSWSARHRYPQPRTPMISPPWSLFNPGAPSCGPRVGMSPMPGTSEWCTL